MTDALQQSQKNAVLLARIDERTAATHSLLLEHVREDKEVHADVESRLRKQERFRFLLLGGALLVAGGGGGIINYLM